MWVYDFLRAPEEAKTWKTHVKANNTFLKFWFSEYYLPSELRLGGFARLSRLIHTLLIYGLVVSYVVSPNDKTWGERCSVRLECKYGCVVDVFPAVTCHTDSTLYLSFGGNRYDKLYRYKGDTAHETRNLFEVCKNSLPQFNDVLEATAAKLWNGRLPRTAVCFPPCKDEAYQRVHEGMGTPTDAERATCRRTRADLSENVCCVVSQYDSALDARPYCRDVPSQLNDLLCVDPDDPCEQDRFEDEIPSSTSGGPTVSVERVFLAILFFIPVQFVCDLLFMYITTVRVENIDEDFRESSSKCMLQWVILLLGIFLVLLVSSRIFYIAEYGRVGSFFLTWLVVILVDQIRNVAAQLIVWYVLIRRMGQVPVMDESIAYAEDEEVAPSPVEIIRRLVQLLVGSRPFEVSVYGVVGMYAIFILVHIGIEDALSNEANEIFESVDTVFLSVFILEIFLHLVAEGISYLMNMWNFFDATIVFVSLGAKLSGAASQSFAVLRLLRLLRLVLVLRKAGAEKKRPHHAGSGLQFSSPVERVIEILRDVKDAKGLPQAQREQIDWASDIISTNKLYSISVDTDKEKSGEMQAIEQEMNDWVKLANNSLADAKGWRDNELENFLQSMAKKAPEEAPEDFVGETMTERFPDVAYRTMLMEYLDGEGLEWKFDWIVLGDPENGPPGESWKDDDDLADLNMLSPIATFILARLGVYASLEIPTDPLWDYFAVIERGYADGGNPYHNSLHAVDTVQSVGCFLQWTVGDSPRAAQLLSSTDLLAAILAASIHDFQHPGVSNQFLIRTKHPMARRYNDVSVLENHHIAAAFHVLLTECQGDPLAQLSEDQFQQCRRSIISMVLATDNQSHLKELSQFKTKMTAKDFPSTKGDDKQVLLNMLLHSADVANAARDLQTFLKWVPRTMEEFFRQGDLEKDKGLPVSMFYDRDTTNVAKCQSIYIDVLCTPLFDVLGNFLPSLKEHCRENLRTNKSHFAAHDTTRHEFEAGDDDLNREGRRRSRFRGIPPIFRFWNRHRRTSARV